VAVKQSVLHWLRRARLLELADAARFRWLALRAAGARAEFAARNPGVALPPDDIAYDAYGMLHWDFYVGFGQLAATFLADQIRARTAPGRVLEWGAGPARIVRHMPDLLGEGWEVFATDANARTVAWCSSHLPRIRFALNAMAPPLDFPQGHFTAIYVVSVFTHLSEPLHRAWVAELRRRLAPGGTLIVTLNGDAARPLLLPFERDRYDAGGLVVRAGVTNGTRCYLAYHPPRYVRDHLLSGFEVRDHLPAPNLFGERQDIWIARRPEEE
jgi:SAM-dependent methyltransferase